MTGDPILTGPVEDTVASTYCASGSYTDFHFDCRVQYPQQASDNGARFNVSLTFNGQLDHDKDDTHVTTDGTALTVSFPSVVLKGNVGKSVNTDFSHRHTLSDFTVVLKKISVKIRYVLFSFKAVQAPCVNNTPVLYMTVFTEKSRTTSFFYRVTISSQLSNTTVMEL